MKGTGASTAESDGGTWTSVAAIGGCAVLWSLGGAWIKVLNHHGELSGAVIACYRALLAGIVFLPGAWRQRATLRGLGAGWLVSSVLLFTLMSGCFVLATTRTAASSAIILQYTAPAWVFLLAPIVIRERPTPLEGLCLLPCLAGVGVIYAGSPATDHRALVMAPASGLGYGGLTLVLRHLRTASADVLVCMNCLGSGLILLPWVGLGPLMHLSGRQAALLVGMALIQFSLAYLLFSWGLQRVEAYRASLITLLEAVLNPVRVYWIVGEPVPSATLVGGPLILAGVAGWILSGRILETNRRGTGEAPRGALADAVKSV